MCSPLQNDDFQSYLTDINEEICTSPRYCILRPLERCDKYNSAVFESQEVFKNTARSHRVVVWHNCTGRGGPVYVRRLVFWSASPSMAGWYSKCNITSRYSVPVRVLWLAIHSEPVLWALIWPGELDKGHWASLLAGSGHAGANLQDLFGRMLHEVHSQCWSPVLSAMCTACSALCIALTGPALGLVVHMVHRAGTGCAPLGAPWLTDPACWFQGWSELHPLPHWPHAPHADLSSVLLAAPAALDPACAPNWFCVPRAVCGD